jgi:hypothetical protein
VIPFFVAANTGGHLADSACCLDCPCLGLMLAKLPLNELEFRAGRENASTRANAIASKGQSSSSR